MNKLRHAAAGIVIFSAFITIFVGIYIGIQENYGFTADALDEGDTILDRLNQLNILEGVNNIKLAIEGLKAGKITNPLDILGNLASLGSGVLKVIGGIVTVPVEILGVFSKLYKLPGIISGLIGGLVVLYVGFIILSVYLKSDI